ncbi:MAG: PAS domain S-box protein [Gracilimonas sp.]|uniref:sensor histidine kinase n=1 Tax=Gracilimonas TaxID=649462 RepID=UPI001AFCDD6B|nr:histidine kinase dimerization/phosphoacceptor domain -containing protein [Gracilimonas sp.]MBO6585473.1 PAS domain S-box protein [Gracilimonas sp.]MBO6616469.1 PAS domain S-box protein [Gracilimonas sp.]
MALENGKKRPDVDQKVVALFAFGIVCAILLILIVNISINTTSGVRGYVGGEGMWTKAQKESVIHLTNYIITENEEEFNHFKSALRVNLGDRTAREELLKNDYNYQKAYDGFIKGKNHPEDIPHMINVFRRFSWTPQVQTAIDIWTEADEKITDLIHFGDSIRTQIQSPEISLGQKTEWVTRIEKMDHEFTDLEVRFSAAMGDLARLVNSVLRWSVITLGLMLIGIGIWLVYRFLNSTRVWMKTLRESEERFKQVLSNSKDVLYKMNLEDREYKYVSPALTSMLGYKPEEFLDGGISFIFSKMHPKDRERIQQVVEKYDHIEDNEFLPFVEFRLKDSSGNWKWVSNVRTLVRGSDGKPEAIIGSVRDISTQKKQDKQIKESLKEKEVLLQEIHHRVKNNLAIISSLLELQKDNVSQDVEDLLSSSQARIKSIAKVHEKLYESSTLSNIPLDAYIRELSEEIKNAYTSDKKNIEIQLDVVPFEIDLDEAIPIGLILNELINNAFKHAFKDHKEGVIRISLEKSGSGMELVVENNGDSIAEDFDPDQSDSLGMTLIRVLIKRVNGTLKIESGERTRFIIQFELGN